MIKETVKYPEFSEIDFIRLYCAMNFKNGCSPIIKHNELEKSYIDFIHYLNLEIYFKIYVLKKIIQIQKTII